MTRNRRLFRTWKSEEDNQDYVVWFKLSNGKIYYVGNGFVFVNIKKPIEIRTFLACAKKYTCSGSKGIMTRLWNKYFSFKYEIENGGHIICSERRSVKDIEKYCKFYNAEDDKYYFNHIL